MTTYMIEDLSYSPHFSKPFPPMPEKFKSVHTQENNKIADIRDAFNKLWYKVFLIGEERTTMADGMLYSIQVVNYTIKDEETGEITPLVVEEFPKPETVDEITDFKDALKIYDECVSQYTSLVKASTRDLQDINVFKDKIGYSQPELSCCATCKHLHKHCQTSPFDLFKANLEQILNLDFECWNPKNVVEYKFDIEVDPKHYPFERLRGRLVRHEDDPKKFTLKPNVQLLHICNNFEKKETN